MDKRLHLHFDELTGETLSWPQVIAAAARGSDDLSTCRSCSASPYETLGHRAMREDGWKAVRHKKSFRWSGLHPKEALEKAAPRRGG